MNEPDADHDGPPLATREVSVTLGDFQVRDLDLALPRGQVTAVVGPNGAGKTTLLRLLARFLQPEAGAVYLDGRAIADLPTRKVARRLAVLPQSRTPPEGVTVRELAGFGRHPHKGLLEPGDEEDRQAVARALEATDMEGFADRRVDSLSGGERQRAWIAMALAQDTDILLLDEPTNHLDIRYEVEVLSLVRQLNAAHGITVGWVLHDLNQAAAYSDHVALLDDGAVVARGPPGETLTAAILEDVFEVPVAVTSHPRADTPYVIPLDPRRTEASSSGVSPIGERP